MFNNNVIRSECVLLDQVACFLYCKTFNKIFVKSKITIILRALENIAKIKLTSSYTKPYSKD